MQEKELKKELEYEKLKLSMKLVEKVNNNLSNN